MRRMHVWLCAMIAVSFAMATAPSVAHPGYGCAKVALLWFEGECYTSPFGQYCDPDFDGEHTRPVGDGVDLRWSNGGAARLPSSGCGVLFSQWAFPAPLPFNAVISGVGGYSGAFSWDVHVHVDGVYWGTAPCSTPGPQQYVRCRFTKGPRPAIVPGLHDVVVSYNVTVGPYYGNMDLDRIEF